MKRSEINNAILWAKDLLARNNIRLPSAAYWSMDDWKANADKIDTIRKVMLGWDVTDFGMGDFSTVGSVLYTVRNGKLDEPSVGVPYCEKYILMKEGQRLPKHYHVFKSEDIINRAGGVLRVYLWNADADGRQLDTDVVVYMDGIKRTFKPGEPIDVQTGDSITLPPYVAHIFGPKDGCGELIAGEVSKVNDDNTDNYFLEDTSRYCVIEEDEAMLHPLCNEYDKL